MRTAESMCGAQLVGCIGWIIRDSTRLETSSRELSGTLFEEYTRISILFLLLPREMLDTTFSM